MYRQIGMSNHMEMAEALLSGADDWPPG